MSQTDKFFDEEIRAIATDSNAIARGAAEELYDDVQRQIRRKFNNPSTAFSRGVKLTHYDNVSYVRLSPILSSHAEEKTLSGSPNLWILLPDGQRLGFKRIGKGFNWSDLKRRYGTRLSFAPVSNGHIVLYRSEVHNYQYQYSDQDGYKYSLYNHDQSPARHTLYRCHGHLSSLQ